MAPRIRFTSAQRRAIAAALGSTGADQAAVIADLEEVVRRARLPTVDMAPILRAARARARDLERMVAACLDALRPLRQADAWEVPTRVVETMLAGAVAVGALPATTVEQCVVDLEYLRDALHAVGVAYAQRPGRPVDTTATWLAACVADVLRRHGVSLTTGRGGSLAQVLTTVYGAAGVPAGVDLFRSRLRPTVRAVSND